MKLKDCKTFKDLEDKVNALGGGPDLDEQTLSTTTDPVTGETTAITISKGNTVPVVHPSADPLPNQEICTGNFSDMRGRTGWLQTWSPIYTANSGTVIEGWVPIGAPDTSPACVTDISVNAFLGNSYQQLRNMQGRIWYDVRLLINGVAVITWTFQNYHYDERSDSDNLDDIMQPMGSVHFSRVNVLANATVSVEVQRRHNFTVRPSTLSTPFGRVISGLRANFNVHYSPVEIVTGRI